MDINNNRKLMITISFLIMVFLGIVASLPGQINPIIKEEFEVSFSQLSFLQILYTLGSILITFISGLLLTKYGLKKFFLTGLTFSTIILSAFYKVNHFWILLILMGFLGSNMGNLVVSSQTIASILFTEKRGKMMNLNHVFFGIGSVVGPYYAVKILNMYNEWKLTYVMSVIFIIILYILSMFSDFPKTKTKTKDSNIKIFGLLKDYKILIIVFILMLNTGAELTIRNWLGVYLHEILNKTQQEISVYLISFNLLFTIGRLIAFFVVERVGYYLMVLGCSIGSAFMIILALFNPLIFDVCFSVIGFFISINFPTIQAILFDMYDDNLSQIVGLSLASSGIGGLLLGNFFIGFVSDIGGIKSGMTTAAVYLGLSIMLLLIFKVKKDKNKLERS